MKLTLWVRAALAIVFAGGSVLNAGICFREGKGPRNDFQFFGGFSPASTTLSGAAPHRKFVVAGFSYSYHCWVWSSVSLNYMATAMPAAILLQPAEVLSSPNPPYQRSVPAHAVYGFGMAPIGITVEPTRKRRFSPFLDTMEGMIASAEPIPENQTNATGLNFLFVGGGGVRRNSDPRHAVTLGYRFMHISNANTTNYNPGVNNNVIYLGYTWSR